MAGYIFKIVIENTHPPVWRRVLVPEKITFQALHEIIQVLFDWENAHLHDFRIPSDDIVIDSEEEDWGNHFEESTTTIDPFLEVYSWIRYTYDFGDEWRHKIIFEKTDDSFTGRMPVLMKAKGDNFLEDSGGLWGGEGENRSAFDFADTEEKLKKMEFPIDETLEEPELPFLSEKNIRKMMGKLEKQLDRFQEFQEEIKKKDEPSVLKKIALFLKTYNGKIKITKTEKTNAELLESLNETEGKDYCKYLQLSIGKSASQQERVSAIAAELHAHPEYFLYIFDENDYAKLVKWMKLPPESLFEKEKNGILFLKLLALGAGRFSIKEEVVELSFAADLPELLNSLNTEIRKKVYRELRRFDDAMAQLLTAYGMLDVETLYELYQMITRRNPEKRDFQRALYWHGRLGNLCQTFYSMNGTCYAGMNELDLNRIYIKMLKFSTGLTWQRYSAEKIRHMVKKSIFRSEYVTMFFEFLHFHMDMEVPEASYYTEEVFYEIWNGVALSELIQDVQEVKKQDWSISQNTDLWSILAGMMLDIELPMLKGRSRLEYAEEMKVSAWQTDMTDDIEMAENKKDTRMFEFPADIQEKMFEAVNYGGEETLEALYSYKKENRIQSEEFLYLLADASITFGKTAEVSSMLEELRRSSHSGKNAARDLEERLQERSDVVDDDWDEKPDWNFGGFWENPYTSVQQPIVRATPKIGRNDPCPCGSGKKYKKCCGRNN